MTDLAVIVPTRERPEAAAELLDAFAETCTAETLLVFAVDQSDPTFDDYARVVRSAEGLAVATVWPSTSMVEALNCAAVHITDVRPDIAAVGFLGDDHRPRTVGWDSAYLSALNVLGNGIVYGNDLLQRENLPTQCAMSAGIIRALGYMAPPELTHLYVDNFWRDLGRSAQCITYLPDVIVEHMHPVAGKAAWTPGHLRVNAGTLFDHDRAAYAAFVDSGQYRAAVDAVVRLNQ